MQIVLHFAVSLCLSVSFSYCQNSSQKAYIWFDNIIGTENSGIINGTLFKESFKTLNNNNQYLISQQFKSGQVTYNSQEFFDASLKYDVYEDQLILRSLDSNGYYAITLVKDLVQAFVINEHHFINSNTLESLKNHSGYSGFYEILLVDFNNISLFKKLQKNKRETQNDDIAYIEFTDEIHYLIYKDKALYNIKSKSTLTKIFPENEDFISSFFFKNKTLMSFDYEKFLITLISELNVQDSK